MKALVFLSLSIAAAAQDSGRCPANSPLRDLASTPSWNGWGNGTSNSRYQGSAAQIDPSQAAKLKLKWAFGFPGAKSVYGQPTVAGGRVFVGVDTGDVYSIDAATGCLYWSYKAAAPVRTAISVGPGKGGDGALVYFGDQKGSAYALNGQTGAEVWKTQVDAHSQARITGAPQLYQSRLYVPVASAEEPAAVDPK